MKTEQSCSQDIGALMLVLPDEAARAVLDRIKRQRWEFSQYMGRGRFSDG